MAAEPAVLVDTNIVVYAYDPSEPVKHERARRILLTLSDAGRLMYSAQVLNEFCSVMLRPNRPPSLPLDRIAEVVGNLVATGQVVPITATTTLLALEAMPRHGLSFWDALIWAAAKENRATVIFTEDFQDGRDIEGVLIHNPFTTAA